MTVEFWTVLNGRSLRKTGEGAWRIEAEPHHNQNAVALTIAPDNESEESQSLSLELYVQEEDEEALESLDEALINWIGLPWNLRPPVARFDPSTRKLVTCLKLP